MRKGRVVFRFGVSLSVVMVAGLAAMWWLASSGVTGGMRWSVGLGLVALVVASGVWLGKRLLRPVDDLQRDAERLLRGWGDTPADDDEFGTLKQAVAYIASHPRERFQVLETERATIAAILDSMTEGVMALDEQRRVVFMNHAARTMLDCAHDPVEGRDLLEVARDQGLTELVEWCRVPNATVPRKREIERPAPFRKMIEIHARPVPLSAQTSGTVLVLRDVTELRRLERVRAEFVVNVSHELRTPLTAIKGYVETLLDEASPESATHRRFLEVAHSHVERMGRLLDDLRNLSDIEMGHVVLDPVPLGLGDVVSEVSAMFEKDAAKKGVALLNQVASRCRVRADRDLLVQILVNLVDNAVKYTPRGGRVTFQAGQEDDRHLRITVRDTGHGIPRADVPRVTERFYRVEKARSREAGGTGLGLAIVKHLVQLHGGTLHIDSEYGKGTTIGFRLPAA
ncbi:MAG: ATP-binding protein [Nitrospira sp.]|nr:ATP-binding protein [Nitrospira sp.]